ncbi:hypothetical protein BT96DRAFT_922509, partial [Gymnopus androsaceus JB14]
MDEFGIPLTRYEELDYTNWDVFSLEPLDLAATSSPPNLIGLIDGANIGYMFVS